MTTTGYIRIREFCSHHGVEESFVFVLQEYELIQLTLEDKEPLLPENELPKLERMLRLHRELEINPQGLQAIHHLLEKVNGLQKEIGLLRRKLKRFEPG